MKLPRLVSRRMFLTGLVATTGLIALVGYKRSISWHKIRNELESKGESFQLTELYKPRIPDSQNFAFTPSLINLRTSAEKRAAITSIIDWQEEARYRYDFVGTEIETAKIAQLGEYLSYLKREEPGFPQPSNPGVIEKAILQEIDRRDQDSILAELGSRIQTPNSQLLPTWVEHPTTNLKFDALFALDSLVKTLNLRATAAARVRDSSTAAISIAIQIQLISAMSKEPFMMPMSETINAHTQMIATLWESLNTGNIDPEGLLTLQTLLSRIDFRSTFPASARTELVLSIDDSADIIFEPPEPGLGGSTFSFPSDFANWIVRDRERARRSEWFFSDFIRPLETGFPALAPALSAADTRLASPVPFLTELSELETRALHPLWLTIARRVILAEALNRLAITACALERHAHLHGDYPASLPELVPKFLPGLPEDPIDSLPLRYLKDQSTTRYKLYSIGLDATDNGGTTHIDDKEDLETSFANKDYTGDWTWRYPTP